MCLMLETVSFLESDKRNNLQFHVDPSPSQSSVQFCILCSNKCVNKIHLKNIRRGGWGDDSVGKALGTQAMKTVVKRTSPLTPAVVQAARKFFAEVRGQVLQPVCGFPDAVGKPISKIMWQPKKIQYQPLTSTAAHPGDYVSTNSCMCPHEHIHVHTHTKYKRKENEDFTINYSYFCCSERNMMNVLIYYLITNIFKCFFEVWICSVDASWNLFPVQNIFILALS